MCGLSLVYCRDHDNHDLCNQLLEPILHRGPDARSIKNFGNITFGHVRLSIQDLTHGTQPFFSNNHALIFNGEIYNCQSLIKKYPFLNDVLSSHSDTELLFHLLEDSALKYISSIDGMYALCFYSLKTKSLYLARDLAGQKPLFLCIFKKRLIVVSDLRQLSSIGIDYTSHIDIPYYLKYGYTMLPHLSSSTSLDLYTDTLYQVKPGTIVKLNLDSDLNLLDFVLDISIGNIHSSDCPISSFTDENNYSKLSEIVKSSVESCLVSDVPVGALLSGGIDSPIIAYYASNHLKLRNREFHTFSLRTNDEFDESNRAADLASNLCTNHHTVDLDYYFDEVFLEFMSYPFDFPFADSAILYCMVLFKYASNYVKVVLSGDGADEVFGGYDFWLKSHIGYISNFQNILKLIRTYSFSLRNNYFRLDSPYRLKSGFFQSSFFRDIDADYPLYANTFHRETLSNLASNEFPIFLDFLDYLPGDILYKTDRASMLYSVEARCPFLSEKILSSFLLNSNGYLIGNKYSPKHLLKQLFSNLYPDFPLAKKQGLGAQMNNLLNRPIVAKYINSFLRQDALVFSLLDNQIDTSSLSSGQTWNLFCLELWLRRLSNES